MANKSKSKNGSELSGKKSSSRSETGHAKNVANYGKLVSFCTGSGAAYNPSNSSLTMEALQTKVASFINTNKTDRNLSQTHNYCIVDFF
jgi:hypothetical protein